MGTLIILEGGDGSGKATQTKCLVERLQAEGHRVQIGRASCRERV